MPLGEIVVKRGDLFRDVGRLVITETEFGVEQMDGGPQPIIEARGRADQPFPPIHEPAAPIGKVRHEIDHLPRGIGEPRHGERRLMGPLEVVLESAATGVDRLHPLGVADIFGKRSYAIDDHGATIEECRSGATTATG